MSATLSICSPATFMSSGENQLLHLSFSPHISRNAIMYYSGEIIGYLRQISKIEDQYFEFAGTTEMNIGVTYYQGTWNISNNLQTRAKLLSLKQILDYDGGEQFKTLFNIWSQWNNEIYVIDVSGLDTIYNQSGILGLTTQPEWDMDNVLGLGMLYTWDGITNSMKTFCPDKVCIARHCNLPCLLVVTCSFSGAILKPKSRAERYVPLLKFFVV